MPGRALEQKYHADKHRRESNIKAGDQVLVDSAQFGPRDHKLSPLYRGPFEVIERFGNTLLITLPRSLYHRHNRVNMDLARNFVSPAQPAANPEEEQFFDVEKVLDMRKATTAPGRRGPKPWEALCKWRGQSWGHSSWTRDLSTMKRLVAEFKPRGTDPEDLAQVRRDAGSDSGSAQRLFRRSG